MKPITFTILFLVSLSIISCKKDEYPTYSSDCSIVQENYNYDTIHPSDYLMTYPGSWWEYSNGDIDSCNAWETIVTSDVQYSGSCTSVSKDRKIVPFSTASGYIYGEEKVIPWSNHYKPTSYITLIDANQGVVETYTTHAGSGLNAQSTEYTITSFGHKDSMNIGGTTFYDLVHMREKREINFPHIGGGPTYIHEYIYSKNIGLIAKINLSFGLNPPDTVHLINHYIAPY